MHPQTNENNQKVFNYYGNLIDVAVNVGCDLMNYDRLHPKPLGGPENIPQIAIFRHFFDLIDSVGILVKSGSGDTPQILLRAALEALIYMDFIFRENTFDRSLSYMVKEIRAEIAKIENIMQFDSTIRANGYDRHIPFEGSEGLNAINEKRRLLSTPPYLRIDTMFEDARTAKGDGKKSKRMSWY